MGDDLAQIEKYSDALERFQQKNFHFIEEKIIGELANFSLAGFESKKMNQVSGGQ